MKKKYKITIGIVAIILLLILLKPGNVRFKQFAGGLNLKPHKTVTRKISDYLVYAIYVKETYMWNSYDNLYELQGKEKYCGYLLNFHKMKN